MGQTGSSRGAALAARQRAIARGGRRVTARDRREGAATARGVNRARARFVAGLRNVGRGLRRQMLREGD